jgi:hypothetical protein
MAYKQANNRKKHLMKTYQKTKNSYGSGVWFDEERGIYRKYTASNTPGYAKAIRKAGNKKFRRTKNVGNHGNYRKHHDYKWILF